MKTLTNIVLMIVMILSGTLTVPGCSCQLDVQPDLEKWLSDSEQVLFAGEVSRIDEIRITSTNGTGSLIVEYRVIFKVTKNWKNADSDQITLTTGAGNGDCGFRFRKGEKYFVDARKQEDIIETDICTWTRTLSSANEITQALEKAMMERKK